LGLEVLINVLTSVFPLHGQTDKLSNRRTKQIA